MYLKSSRSNTSVPKPIVEKLEQVDKLYIGFTFNILADPNSWILKDWSWPPHYHDYIELMIPLGIAGEITIVGQRLPVHDNSVYCIPPNIVHSLWLKRRTTNRCCIVRINPQPFKPVFDIALGENGTWESYLKSISPVHTKKADLIKKLVLQLSHLQELPAHADIPAADLENVLADFAILSRVFSILLKEKGPLMTDASCSEWTRTTLAVIDSFSDRSGSINAIARKCNMSMYHFCRKFKRSTGITVHRYLNQMRINRAKYLLSVGGLSVTDVCLEAGFCSVSHFIKIFSVMVGETPKQWMLKNRTGPY